MAWHKFLCMKFLERINKNWSYRTIEQFHFNRLQRRYPELAWKALAPGPMARLDAGGVRIGHELFLFGGAALGGKAISRVDIFDLEKEKWIKGLSLPSSVAQTHHAITGDGRRYIYLISGQLGSHCSPATNQCFVFDTVTRSWQDFIPLPKPRYAPTAQIWNDRLHVLGGSQEDRTTVAVDHWSIGINQGRATESTWHNEMPVPRGGPHRASAIIEGRLYVFGGQEGDYIAIPGHPDFLCTGELTCDLVYPDTYMLEHRSKSWQRMADMPIAASHTENTVIYNKDSIAIVGGQHYKDPQSAVITLTDVIQVYNAKQDAWKIAGRLPYGIKETVAVEYHGCLYFTSGQRDRGQHDRTAGFFEKGVWKALIEAEIFWPLTWKKVRNP